jgi:hypothetical protein
MGCVPTGTKNASCPVMQSAGRRRGQVVLGGVLLVGTLGSGGVLADQRPPLRPVEPVEQVELAPAPPILRRLGSCTDVGLKDLVFSQAVRIDEVRVLTRRSDGRAGGESLVRVDIEAGGNLRRILASPSGARAIKFSPALHSDRVRVALDPDLQGDLDTCVVRVDLYSAGQLIRSIYP